MNKAYHVWDSTNEDGQHLIIFAPTAQVARKGGNLDCDRFIDVRAVRAPAFDDLATQTTEITSRQYIERGWWMSCGWCEARVSDEEPVIYSAGDIFAYCSDGCKELHAPRFRQYLTQAQEQLNTLAASIFG